MLNVHRAKINPQHQGYQMVCHVDTSQIWISVLHPDMLANLYLHSVTFLYRRIAHSPNNHIGCYRSCLARKPTVLIWNKYIFCQFVWVLHSCNGIFCNISNKALFKCSMYLNVHALVLVFYVYCHINVYNAASLFC